MSVFQKNQPASVKNLYYFKNQLQIERSEDPALRDAISLRSPSVP
jgi:hypothetical protein